MNYPDCMNSCMHSLHQVYSTLHLRLRSSISCEMSGNDVAPDREALLRDAVAFLRDVKVGFSAEEKRGLYS
jgi:hypothetical protein